MLQAHQKFVREAKVAHEAVLTGLKIRAAYADVREDYQLVRSNAETTRRPMLL